MTAARDPAHHHTATLATATAALVAAVAELRAALDAAERGRKPPRGAK